MLKAKLTEYPDIHYTEGTGYIEVPPKDDSGFEVGLRAEGDGFRVNFDGWHEEFDSAEEAVSCFGFGLSDRCRLRVTYRGSFPTRWAAESLEDGQWVQFGVTALLVFPFWRRKHLVYKQNHALLSG